MSRTAVIYRPDELCYLLTLRDFEGGVSTTRRYRYVDVGEMMEDIKSYLALGCPEICYGAEYSGDIRGLLVAINCHKGCLNIRYNVSADPEGIAEIFRNVTVNQLMM